METTTPQALPSVTAVAGRYGLATGLVTVVLSLLSFTLALQDNWAMRVLSVVVLVAGIVLAQRTFRQQNAGYLNYGEGIGIAVLVGCVVGILSAVFFYVYVAFIAPEFPQVIIEKARQGMEAKGTMTDEQIEQGIAITTKFMTPIMLGSALIGSIFYALVIGLISSAFLKNSKPEFE